MIDLDKFKQEINLFKEKLAPNQNQKDAFSLAETETRKMLQSEAEKKGHPLERAYLVAICGELQTKKQQGAFTTRLILLDLLLSDK